MLPPPVANVLNQVKARWAALSRPLRIMAVSTTLLTVGIGGFFAYNESHENYTVLFSQMDQDDAAATVAKLKELKTPYKLEAGGGTILVPDSKAPELRLELASAGLPRGGGVGFESFDKMRLGATEFEQHVLYRRALEGELARSIGSIDAVQSARVHLVMPEKSVFVQRAEPASASIVLKLRGGRSIGPSEVAGIVHLTAASVPGLTADRVAIVDTEGQMLKKPHVGADGTAGDGDDERAAQQRQVESQLEERTRQMLEKVVGQGHVDVRVTAELDAARVERVEDHYDPAKQVLRSEEASLEHTAAATDQGVAGVPGAESNLPGGAATPGAAAAAAASAVTPTPTPAASASAAANAADGGAPPAVKPAPSAVASNATTTPAANAGLVRESHTRNFEIDHISEKRTVGSGALKRIAVAVVLDGVPVWIDGKESMAPRSKAELDHLSALVRSAVGANDARGDEVTVDSVPFEDSIALAQANANAAAPGAPAIPTALQAKIKKFGPFVGAGLGAVVVLALLLSMRRGKKKRAVQMAVEIEKAKAAALPPAIVEGIIEEPSKPLPEPIDLRAVAIERATQDPATAALVLKAWLGATDMVEPVKKEMVKAA